jgi:hypothetical protein
MEELYAELATTEQPGIPPKPFHAPGQWFPTELLGHPMREYAPGKWESALWPSEQPGSSVQGEAKPLVWIEQSVYDDLITEKPWVFGANNTFCQRRTDEYTIPLYTTPPPAPAAEQGES